MNRDHRFPGIIRLIGAIVGGCCLCACQSTKTYQYETIRRDFAQYICHVQETATTGATDDACDTDLELTLEKAIDLSLRNNPELVASQARIISSQAGASAAKSVFYPHLSAYTEYLNGDAPSTYLFKTIDQRELSPGVDFNDPGRIRNFESGINLGLNLYNGGRDRLHRDMAEIGVNMAELQLQQIQNELVALVLGAYLDGLAAEAFIKIAHESASTVQAELELMNVRYHAGGALKSDILSLEVRLAGAREEAVKAENRSRMALTRLAELLGVSPDQPLKIQPAALDRMSIPQDYAAGLGRGITMRPELLSVRENMRRARMALDAAIAGYLPRLELKARCYLDDEDGAYSAGRNNWLAAATAHWDLFSGFSTKAEIAKSKAELEALFALDRKTELAIRADVKNAYLLLAEAESRMEVARSSVQMAEESLTLVKRQYEGGSATITRYLEAELGLHRAKMSSTTAFYDQAKALANIGRAIGLFHKFQEIGFFP